MLGKAFLDRGARFRTAQGGGVAAFFALAAVPLLGGVALSVDYATATNTKSRLQQVLDAALLAGIHAPQDERVARAQSAFAAQAPDAKVLSPAATIELTANGGLSGTATGRSVSIFGSGGHEVNVRAEVGGVAAASPGAGCFTLLDPTGNQALLLNSGANITARDCEVHVHSSANPATIYNAGMRLDVKKLCVKGKILFNSPTMRPPFEESCTPAADPLAGKIPAVTTSGPCAYENRTFDPSGSGETQVNPGIWCGWNNFNGTQKIVFRPGLHIVRSGGITVNSGSEIVADGATFFFVDDTQLRMNGNVKLTLKAPTSGPWAGIAMAEQKGNYRGQFIFNGFNGQSIKGAIYLPNRELVFNSASTAEMDEVTIVGYRAILNSTTWNIRRAAQVGGGSGTMDNPIVRLSR